MDRLGRALRSVRALAGMSAATLVRRPDDAFKGFVGSLQFALPPRAIRMRRVRPYAIPSRRADAVDPARLPREFVLVVHHDGLEREALVHLPPGFESGAPIPFILNFHGFTSDAQEQADYTQLAPIAARHGFAVVHPQGIHSLLGYRAWNAGDYWARAMRPAVDDVGFVARLMERLAALFPVADWFATGISNGGMLAYRLVHELPGRFSAIAPVAAVDLGDAPLRGEHLGVFHVHGAVDGLVPFHEPHFRIAARLAGLGWPRSARESVARFAQHLGAARPEVHTRSGRRYEIWRGPSAVAQLVVHRGGHTWLGDGYRIARANEPAVATGSLEIVRFFLDHRRR